MDVLVTCYTGGLVAYFQRLSESITFACRLALDVVEYLFDYIVYLPVYVGIAVLITTSVFIVRFLLFK